MTGRRAVRALLAATAIAVAAGVTPAHAEPREPAVARCTQAAEAGQRLRARGQLRSAGEQFAICIAASCPALVRRHCDKWRVEIEDATPTLVFRVVDPDGHDIPSGSIRLDDELVAGASDGRALPVDPGQHRVVWQDDTREVAQEIVVHEGERNRTVRIVVAPTKPAAVPPPPRANADRGSDAAREPPPPQGPTRSAWPWLFASVGAVAGATGGVLWYLGAKTHDDLSATCAVASSCDATDVRVARTQLVVGDALMAVSVVAIATAVVWYLVEGGGRGERARSALAASEALQVRHERGLVRFW